VPSNPALVLGEPALVPPTAKSRMYGLVKGPESIPFRKPAGPLPSHDDESGFSEQLQTHRPSRCRFWAGSANVPYRFFWSVRASPPRSCYSGPSGMW